MSEPSSNDDHTPRGALGACRVAFGFVGLFSFCINVLMLTVPLYMLQVYDRVLSSQSRATLGFLTLLAVVALVVFAVLDLVRLRILVRVGQWLERRLAPPAFGLGLKASLSAGAYRGEALRDIQQVRGFLSGAGVIALFDAPWVPMYLLVIFALHPWLGVITLGGAVLVFGCALGNEFLTRAPLAEANRLSLQANAQVEGALRAPEAIQAMGMTDAVTERWQAQSEAALSCQVKAAERAGLILAIAKFLRLSLQIAVLGVGALLVLQQALTAGAMIAASILTARALAPVEQSLGAWRQWVAARLAFARLGKFFEVLKTQPKPQALPAPQGYLSVEQLSFAYAGASRLTLKGIAFALAPGEALAIVGPSAAGKSTLVKLLLGLQAPTGGKVRLDGADVLRWDAAQFGAAIGYLPQEVALFAGTVAENIARFKPGPPHAVVEAAQHAGVHETILRLNQGYETELLEGGANLSAGQRQRIGLARALYGRPRLVVLDEPNANLDGEGEQALIDAIATLKQHGAGVIIIAHRPSVLGNVDKVLVLRGGMIESMGPRCEIIKQLTQPRTVDSEARP